MDHFWANKDRVIFYHVEYDDEDAQDYTAEELAPIIIKQDAHQSVNAMVIEEEDEDESELEDYYCNSIKGIPLR